MSDANFLDVTVRSRQRIIYQGQAKSLTSINEAGKFNILPLHANFISLLKGNLEIIEQNGNKLDIPTQNGVLRVIENQAQVFIGIEKDQNV